MAWCEISSNRIISKSINQSFGQVYQKRLPNTVTALCWDGNNVVWLGSVAGTLRDWNLLTATEISEHHAHSGNYVILLVKPYTGVPSVNFHVCHTVTIKLALTLYSMKI